MNNFKIEGKKLIKCYDMSGETTAIIPNGVESIENGAFAGCRSLRKVVIPSSVLTVGECLFVNCKKSLTVYCCAPKKPRHWSRNWNLFYAMTGSMLRFHLSLEKSNLKQDIKAEKSLMKIDKSDNAKFIEHKTMLEERKEDLKYVKRAKAYVVWNYVPEQSESNVELSRERLLRT